MKKKVFVFIGVIAFAVAVAFNSNVGLKSNAEMLILNNVEALAQIECTAFETCGSGCNGEFCGYCLGFYMTQCIRM